MTFIADQYLARGVPREVTMRQARRALRAAGLISSVDAAIDAMPEPARSDALIDWEFSNALERDNPLVVALGPALGLTEEQIDDLFRAAAKL